MKYEVNVESPGEDQAAFLKALRTVGGISLKHAADIHAYLVRFKNSTLVSGIDKSVAEHVARTLATSGAKAIVRESTADTPMMCYPEANARFQWGSFRTMRRLSHTDV